MAGEVRQRMIEGAVRLLATKGLEGTSFSELLALTKAPRGSLYHHFPGGKDELVMAALELAGGRALAALEASNGASAEEVANTFLGLWRLLLTRSQFTAGCSVLAVTVATDSPQLLERAAAVFRSWRAWLSTLLHRGGLTKRDAERMAVMLIASSEGAVVLSRAERSLEPFELVAEQLLTQVRALLRK